MDKNKSYNPTLFKMKFEDGIPIIYSTVTLRDLFAMSKQLTERERLCLEYHDSIPGYHGPKGEELEARIRYAYADAMLAEREK